MAGEPLLIHGDGMQTRDFTYIDDAVDATLMAGIHPRAEGEVFNIGTGIETSVTSLAEVIGRALDRPIEINHIDRRDIDNIRRRVVKIEKIRRMLHWGAPGHPRSGAGRDRQMAGRQHHLRRALKAFA
jgi:UDP-glucose 4-epimerase